ncbi:hypothetical protein EJB05_04078, partial [Eragrostis curvula]
MDATTRLPSFMVLDSMVDLDDLVGPPPPEWESIYFSTKKAYGCGEHGQKLVEGLALYVQVHHRDSGHASSLCICLSDEAFQSIRAELLGCTQGRVTARGFISNAMHRQLLVLIVTFRSDSSTSMRHYCLVFDSTDASLCMGVAYCDLRARDGVLKFNFAELPRAYRIHIDWWTDEPKESPRMSRTIGCDGNSVKFICIDRRRHHGRRGGDVVELEVWTLDLDYGLWKKSEVVLWKELWKKVKFMMPEAEFGDVVPQYPPVLTPDGALCLLLRNTRRRRSSSVETDFLCRFDMRSKCLLNAGRVVDYDTSGRLVMPYDFFTMSNPPPSRKRKLPCVLEQIPEPKRRKSAEKASRRRVCCRASCCGRDI